MVQALTDIAAQALPDYLRQVWEMCRDAELVAEEAESFVQLARLEGCVGPEKSRLAVRRVGGDWLRIDCGNNHEFWMEIDVNTLKTRGRAPSSMHTGTRGGLLLGTFQVRRFTVAQAVPAIAAPPVGSDTIRVTHSSCPTFFVELTV